MLDYPDPTRLPGTTILGLIEARWTTFPAFQAEFEKAAVGLFGSGWAWLTVCDKKLAIETTPNQDIPTCPPILGLDVWEHAYYLQYRQNRLAYVQNFWSIVDWEMVGYFLDTYAMLGRFVPI
jgi:Fe-Mn family superoxide dismutase